MLIAICIVLLVFDFMSVFAGWLNMGINRSYWYEADYVIDMFKLIRNSILFSGIYTTISWILVFVTIRMMLWDYSETGNLLTINRMGDRGKVKVYSCVALSVINIILLFLQWILLRRDYLCIDDGDLAITAMFKHGWMYVYYWTAYDVIVLILVIDVFKSVKRNLFQIENKETDKLTQ